MSEHHVNAVPQGARGGRQIPEPGVTEVSLCDCWESNLDSLEEQPVVLAAYVSIPLMQYFC